MKKTVLILFVAILMLVSTWSYRAIKLRNEMAVAENLAAFGEEQFYRNDFKPYLDRLRNNGLSDLMVDISFVYDYEHDYDKDSKSLWLRCIINDMTSDMIDDYYTTEYNGANGKKLSTLMDSIKENYSQKYKYTSSEGETVYLSIYEPKYDIAIHTSFGREYEYKFGYTDSVTVEIDGDWVYYAESTKAKEPVYYSGKCKYGDCRSSAREGSYYCHIHSCCIDDCSNRKEPTVHCCNTHNCNEPGCGRHKYTAANSEYCNIHYLAHYDD